MTADVVYSDFSKAFDSVYSLNYSFNYHSDIKYELLAWLNSFLVDRCQCVSIYEVLSE